MTNTPNLDRMTPTLAEAALIERLNGQVWLSPTGPCPLCACRLERRLFSELACARCEIGWLWSHEAIRQVQALPGHDLWVQSERWVPPTMEVIRDEEEAAARVSGTAWCVAA